MAGRGHIGRYKPKNAKKYVGDPKNIIYRSSWECRYMSYLDRHPNVLQWASEEPFMIIPYRSPHDRKIHRYFPDFWVRQVNLDGQEEELLVEVKPAAQVAKPVKKKNKRRKTFIRETTTWMTNTAKWDAARQVCKKKGWDFRIFTEYELGIKARKF